MIKKFDLQENEPYRVYKIHNGDIFSVNINTFLAESLLWSHDFQILKTITHKRKHWWQLWKPWKTIEIQMMYIGKEN